MVDNDSPALESLNRLVGTWNVSGPKIRGRVAFEWMEGGIFVVQRVDLDHAGSAIRGVEYIGHDEESGRLRSRYFGNSPGVLEYVSELEGDTLRIFFGDADSPARFEGRFSEDGYTNTGAWTWPGGGYESTMTRTSGEAP